MTEAALKFILSRVIQNAGDAFEEAKRNRDDAYCIGRKIAYYEVLDIMKSELEVRDQDLKKFGLDIDLDKWISQ